MNTPPIASKYPVIVTKNAVHRLASILGRYPDIRSMHRMLTRLYFLGEAFILGEDQEDKVVTVHPENTTVVLCVRRDAQNKEQMVVTTVLTLGHAKALREKIEKQSQEDA